MARTEISRGEIDLNSIKFKLGGDGQVHMFYASQFAQKQVIGDYTLDSDPERSAWAVISDQRGGIGVEDLVRPEQVNQSWFTDLNLDYAGNAVLPKLASAQTLTTLPTITDGGLEVWTSASNLTNWTETLSDGGTQTAIAQESTNVRTGTYSARLTATGTTRYAQIEQIQTNWSNNFRGKPITVTIYIKATEAGTQGGAVTLYVGDNAGNTSGALTTFTGGWEAITVTHTLAATATELHIYVRAGTSGADAGNSITCYVDDIAFIATTPFGSKACDFDGDAYFPSGAALYRIEGGDGVTYLEGIFPAAITDLIAGVNSCLYVFLGDSDNYWYRTTAAVWAQTDSASAYYGVHWNNQLAKISSAGAFAVATTPNAASPSWTAKITLDTGTSGTINSLITYLNASRVDSIYAGCTRGVWNWDATNNLWLNTDLQVPSHADNGKGMVVQNGKLYYSAGLTIYEYSLTSEGLVIRNIGLSKDDGLPDSYVGSIVNLIRGYEGIFYALVDASLISSSNYSLILKYENGAWRPFWLDGSANEAMYCGLASSVYAYRFWCAVGSALNWFPLDRSKRNPTKVSTSTYGASGIYISPNFDGFWPVGSKVALATKALAKGTTADETVIIKYRINKVNTDVGTGWTTLDTLVLADAGVESAAKFASSVGLEFKTIQFRVDFARGSTNTATPNLIYLILEYEKIISPKWGFSFTLNCLDTVGNRTPQQQRDAIITIVESKVLVPFYYGGPSEPRYVRVKPAAGERLTGQASLGQYRLVAIEK